MRARRFEQGERALDVGADELGRAVDAAVDVALGREVDDGARPVLGEQAIEQRAGRRCRRARRRGARSPSSDGQVLGVAGVGEGVEIDDRLVACGQPVEDEIRADEAGAAGDEDHVRRPGEEAAEVFRG